MNTKDIAIVTYPRCGSSYLYWLLSTSFGKNVLKTHIYDDDSIKKYKELYYVITVLRNPVDAISSFVTMESFYWRKDRDLNEYLEETIPQRIDDYINFYTAIDKVYNIMLDYQQINIFRGKLLNILSKETDNDIVNFNYVDLIKDSEKHYFLRSSKKTNEYNYIKNKVLEKDLSKCYEIYNQLKNKITDLSVDFISRESN